MGSHHTRSGSTPSAAPGPPPPPLPNAGRGDLLSAIRGPATLKAAGARQTEGNGGGDRGPTDLLKQIEGGMKLRSTADLALGGPVNDEPDLLSEIRSGMKLRKVDPNGQAEKKTTPSGGNSIANAMEQYRKLVADSESDQSESDSDWSD